MTRVDVQSVTHAVRTLVTHLGFPMSMRLLLDVNWNSDLTFPFFQETKIHRIEGKQVL